jgi:hypothetical protein
MGPYPLFCCRDWHALQDDLDRLDGLVSVSLVADPFLTVDEAWLRRCFPDLVIPFKSHFITDLHRPIEEIVSRHHRYYARRALARVAVTRCDVPDQHLDEWMTLYDHLIARHALTGVKAFSRAAFAAQLQVPGMVMLRATAGNQTVGAHLWFAQGDVVYSHLAAVSSAGYELMASYALHWSALQTFAPEARWLGLGAGAGVQTLAAGGLAAFKQGWATGTRMAYFCGRVLDRPAYNRLVAERRAQVEGYFPAYRSGEFA